MTRSRIQRDQRSHRMADQVDLLCFRGIEQGDGPFGHLANALQCRSL
jgi:hypothetical protein